MTINEINRHRPAANREPSDAERPRTVALRDGRPGDAAEVAVENREIHVLRIGVLFRRQIKPHGHAADEGIADAREFQNLDARLAEGAGSKAGSSRALRAGWRMYLTFTLHRSFSVSVTFMPKWRAPPMRWARTWSPGLRAATLIGLPPGAVRRMVSAFWRTSAISFPASFGPDEHQRAALDLGAADVARPARGRRGPRSATSSPAFSSLR